MIKHSNEYAKKLILMALRCDYARIQGGELSKRGKGIFSPRIWRVINEIKCIFNHKWAFDMSNMLMDIIEAEDARNAVHSGNTIPDKLNVPVTDEQAN